tara:strand:+ start:19 stop:192 length:174 start_codon:yes stop_codon:yes gene_type:complete
MNMKEKNPEFTKSHWSYKNRIATKCRICGGQLLLPEEMQQQYHTACAEKIEDNTYSM